MYDRIRKALPADLLAEFEYLMLQKATSEMDLDIAEAKLAGEWPGFEWMIEAKTANGYK